MDLRVDIDRLRGDLEQLARFGADDRGGVTRTSFSVADRQARAWLAERAAEAGLAMRTDGIGNIFLRAPGQPDGPAVWTGSHLDSVPNGGAFDGALGSMAERPAVGDRSEEHTSELQSREKLVCRLLLEKKN